MIDPVLLLIPLICFIGAYLSTVAGMGGGLLILAGCSQILPLPAVVPLSSVIVMAGQVARCVQFHPYIDWNIARPFIPGSMLGAVLGSFIYLALPDTAIALLLGTVMLWFCWIPSTSTSRRLAQQIPHPFFWIGIVHTFLSSIAGVGGLFQSMMVNSPLSREGIVATIAGTLLFMSIFKTTSYIAGGFNYLPYLEVILLCWVTGTLGTALGKISLYRVSDKLFRKLIKAMVTIFSLRLFWQVMQSGLPGSLSFVW